MKFIKYIFCLCVLSCGMPKFNVIKINIEGSDFSKMKNVLAYVLEQKHSFHLMSEDENKLEFIKDIKDLSILKEDKKKITKSKLLVLTIYRLENFVYIKSSILLNTLKLNVGADKDNIREKNIDKSDTSLLSVKINKKDGIYLSTILSDFFNSMDTKYIYEEIEEKDMDSKIVEHLKPFYLGGEDS